MKPVSRGHVRLRSADPLEPPEIDPAFLTDPAGRDIAVVRAGLEKVGELAAAMKPLAGPSDGPPAQALSDAALRGRVGTYWHPVGTCAMGPAQDPRSVTDGQGAVHGVAGLRVADASVLPTVPAANTQLPVLAVAEMLADTLRA
ncbi:GMC family oxidoreductase [Streptomyces sp. NPDC029006]|uniref:GMC family oxidoreductase n=1 Tax=Streptomyces sp. NPDC029006 TaxID=3155467 RepID=UPI0033F74DA8